MNQNVDVFLKSVLEKVKYKKIHSYLTQELDDHIEMLKDEFVEVGLDEETAYKKAIQQMGEPAEIGENLHKLHKPKMEWSVLILLMGLIGIGVFTLAVYAQQVDNYAFKRQIVFGIVGIGIFLAAYLMNYKKLEKWSLGIYGLGLMVLLLVDLFGISVNGTRNWLRVGPVNIQATSIALPLFVIAFVGLVRRWGNKGILGVGGLFLTGLCGSLFLFRLNHVVMGIELMMAHLVAFIIYIFSSEFKGSRKRVVAMIMGSGLAVLGAAGYAIITVPYRIIRIKAFFDSESYDIVTSNLRQISEQANWIGKSGFPGGIEGGLPVPLNEGAISEYIFSFILGNMGILMAVVVVLIVGLLIIRCFKCTKKINDSYGRQILYAISFFFTL